MSGYISPETIKDLRTAHAMTQEQLAAQIGVTAKAVSKWETGRGLPDISLIEPLAQAFCVSVAELITGEVARNENRSGNVRKSIFHVCPICGNVVWSLGANAASCCGIQMIQLEAESFDDQHVIHTDRIDGEYFVSIDHPMSKEHYISFIACVCDDEVQIKKLYPEGSAEARFGIHGPCDFYAYCNRHGLLRTRAGHAVQENEKLYGEEARAKYGDEAIDAANRKVLAMDDREWQNKEELEDAIIDQLIKAMATGDASGEQAQKLAHMHERWIRMQWADGAYSRQAHLGLAKLYLNDERFSDYYESRAGKGACAFLADALDAYLA